jgi:hypothetical protein
MNATVSKGAKRGGIDRGGLGSERTTEDQDPASPGIHQALIKARRLNLLKERIDKGRNRTPLSQHDQDTEKE